MTEEHNNVTITKSVALLGTFQSVMLVVIGVAASGLPDLFSIGVLVTAFVFLLVTQYVLWIRNQPNQYRLQLLSHLQDRTNLLRVMSEIGTHCRNSTSFTKSDFVVAIRWWIEEDLWSDYHMDLEIEEQESLRRRVQRPSLLNQVSHPVRYCKTYFWSIRRKLIQSEQAHLIEVTHSMTNDQIASIVIGRGIDEQFIEENLVPGDHPSEARIKYVWSPDIVRLSEDKA